MSIEPYAIEISAASAYVSQHSDPEESRYLFAYTIVIKNSGQVAAQLKTRHWVITDSNGKVEEVRGEGVVGEQPLLQPGEEFSYTSAAVIETPVGSMHGSYQMVTPDGIEFDAEIPAFGLSMPNVLH